MNRLLALLTLLAACGGPAAESPEAASSEAESPIINGLACGATEEPTAVAILIDATFRYGQQTFDQTTVICTGTLIAPDVVLTAAHCVDPDVLTGGFGEVDRADYYIAFDNDLTALAEQTSTTIPVTAVKAVKALKNPAFDIRTMDGSVAGPGAYHDVGLIFLSRPLEQKPEIVITADEAGQLDKGTGVRIVGWGQQTNGQNTPHGTVGVKICGNSYINELGAAEMQIGGDTTTVRKCHGDSGGPSFATITTPFTNKRRVVGITSHAYDQTDCAKGGVDTRVDAQLDWIDAEMTKACDSGLRRWCDVKGLLPPLYFEKAPEEQGQPGTGSGGDAPTSRAGGCDIGGASVLGLAGLVVAGLRRRRSKN